MPSRCGALYNPLEPESASSSAVSAGVLAASSGGDEALPPLTMQGLTTFTHTRRSDRRRRSSLRPGSCHVRPPCPSAHDCDKGHSPGHGQRCDRVAQGVVDHSASVGDSGQEPHGLQDAYCIHNSPDGERCSPWAWPISSLHSTPRSVGGAPSPNVRPSAARLWPVASAPSVGARQLDAPASQHTLGFSRRSPRRLLA